jgi:endonuclease G
MNKLLNKALVLLCLFSGAALASPCDNLLPYGYPTAAIGIHTMQLCRRAYVVDYDLEFKDPLYSAEHLLGSHVEGSEPRKPFQEDHQVPESSRALIKDFIKSGYDKGHMSPAGDFHDDTIEMQESFLLSNMVPQALANNRVIWRGIETFVRKQAVVRGDLYVITGPIFSSTNRQSIGESKIEVPESTFKVVIDTHKNEGIAFIVPNNNSVAGHKPVEYVRPIADVETAITRNLTPNLSGVKAEELKNVVGKSFLDDLTHAK